ncbi:hypothetical protein M9H77_16672 [Catharanthus roseus]|uniref:Uncharacterized protein n=1 Tax=Catharanthus roseus TaxID=4058 RepID=A0ACC0B2F1_CATRO|nr:hypothetical protein M9H77_16672 [Catharanthus roseus]
MGVRESLHPQQNSSNKPYLLAACFTMSKKEKVNLCRVLKKMKVPDRYDANVSRCIQIMPPKVSGLKSHDNHVLIQQLFPLALRKLLPKIVRSSLLWFCRYLKTLCSKIPEPRDIAKLEKEIAETLCQLERIFPPSFFDVMVHLSIHLATEAKLGRAVQYRWIYPIERY